MTKRHVYLDYNATTPLRDEVKQQMIKDFDVYGNASSLHSAGRLAHNRVEEARANVAALIGAPANTIVFTSGASESNNTVVNTFRRLASGPNGAPLDKGRIGIITSPIEHPCIMNSTGFLKSMGFKVTYIPVDEYGKLDMDAYRKALNEDTLLVSVMMANNELGTIEDIKEIAAMAKAKGAWMHTDAAQTAGKIPVDVNNLGVDYMTMSGHKLYGPKGVGALYIREGAPIFPLVHGGHQEDGIRAGTYNNFGILGFGKAAEVAKNDIELYSTRIRPLRNRLRDGLLEHIPNIKINGHPTDVLPNTLDVSFPGAEGESILLAMDLEGIEASTGSACASGSLEPSHVLMAVGVGPELAHGSIRFSMGWGLTEEDIDYAIEKLPPIIERLRKMSTAKAA
jgi:cysteine desulfurase